LELQLRHLAVKVRECYKPLHEVSNALRFPIVFACLAVAAGCRGPEAASLDAAAAEYVRLAREETRSDPEYRSALADLHRRIRALEEQHGRRAFLLAQLAALQRRARFTAGERVTIRAEAASLGIPLPRFDASRAARLRAELDAGLPGSGSLPERLAAYHQAHRIPRVQLDSTAKRLVADCRARTPMPEAFQDAGVELRYVVDQPWPAFTHYRGRGSSQVDVRRDLTWTEENLRVVLCHETYPGHHVQHLVWAGLAATLGWVEMTVMPLFTPQALMAERSAVTATRLLWPEQDQSRVQRALLDLAPLATAVAVDVVDGNTDRTSALASLRDDLLMPNADEFLRFVEQYRSMSLAYITPAPDVNDWQSYLELLRSPERLVAGAEHGAP
jgi:hypothetical protein